MPINILRVSVNRMGPDSFQCCSVTGQGAMGTNLSTGCSVWTWGRTSLLQGWQSTGTGCPERLWILLFWRHSKSTWMKSCAVCSRWPCFSRGVGLDDLQRSLPTPTILWSTISNFFSPLHHIHEYSKLTKYNNFKNYFVAISCTQNSNPCSNK